MKKKQNILDAKEFRKPDIPENQEPKRFQMI
jgi:hypothetical protein